MLKVYCTECGNPTTYAASKPKFCSACGKSFDKLVVNKVLLQKSTTDQLKPIKKILPKLERKAEIQNDHNDDDDYPDVNHVPEINDLDIEIQDNPVIKKTKIGDIIGSSKSSFKREKIKNKSLSKAEREKFLEDFRREAGAIRPKSRGQKDG